MRSLGKKHTRTTTSQPHDGGQSGHDAAAGQGPAKPPPTGVAAACHRQYRRAGPGLPSQRVRHRRCGPDDPRPPAGWIILSDSGPEGDQLEDLSATLGEGPRVDAFTTGVPVAAADLVQAHARWPSFAARALACGIRAIFAFPVQQGTEPIGVLSVYRSTPGPLSATDRAQIGRYADTAAALLRVDDTGQARVCLPRDAVEVQQAVGVIMEHATVDAATALHRLRVYAHHSRRPMRDVVAEVRTADLPFNPLKQT
jgi:GAF domain-containing protein